MSMFDDAMSVTMSGLKAQATRLRVITENIANVDTPGFRRKMVPFQVEDASSGLINQVKVGKVELDDSELPDIHDPGHPMANDSGYYQGSNVNIVIEIADAREAQRSYEANLKMYEQTKTMTAGLMDLLRN